MSTQKGNLLTLIAVVIALVFVVSASFYAGANYYRSQNEVLTLLNDFDKIEEPKTTPTLAPTTQNETANWKTYFNSTDSYSLKYPPTWEFEELEKNWVAFFPKGSNHDTSVDGNLQLQIQAAEDNRTIDYLKLEYFSNATETSIEGKPALKLKEWAIIKPTELRGIEISSFSTEGTEVFDQILSTFRFTN